ncbi:MAG TPA: alpha/beta hydrolase-fold protein [Gemmata sp.]|nr:alpha/beta hydrolase-fold protein [Gemmata sp.]
MTRFVLSLLTLAVGMLPAIAQQPRQPTVNSPEVKGKQVTFRLYAPKAEKAGLLSSDIPGAPRGFAPREMKKGENGVWELTLDVAPGANRYLYDIDGARAVDPRNPAVSESVGNVWSLVRVPGAAFMDTTDVPHGAVASVTYKSSTVGKNRRAHVYTPPGYETSTEKYPVFYLLHGAGDSDDSWTSVGRANDILDNLIAAKKSVPMIVVMPAGHTGPSAFVGPGAPRPKGPPPARFEDDFEKDLRPYIERTYRVKTDRADRAIAGLSMGGGQTLSLFGANPTEFSAVGVFSSGIFAKGDAWENQHKEALSAPASHKGLKVLWFATGKDDFLIDRTKESVELFKKYGFKPEFKETEGGHTWINWQHYLIEFAPMLFK